MLGRVQNQHQLSIIGSLPEEKIYPDKKALEQLLMMKKKSINENPPIWEKTQESIKVYFHNVQSLTAKLEDIKADFIPFYADIIIFAETWLTPETSEFDHTIQVENYKLHLNSVGRGKGLAVYYKESTSSIIESSSGTFNQITKLETKQLTIICLYRSFGDISLESQLKRMIPHSGSCLVIGDFNICSLQQPNHQLFKSLRAMGFKILRTESTHSRGGHLDQAWIRDMNESCNLLLYTPYYSCRDHDALLFTSYVNELVLGKSLHKFYKTCIDLF